MNSGVFEVGETIIGIVRTSTLSEDLTPGVTDVQIQFRVASSNLDALMCSYNPDPNAVNFKFSKTHFRSHPSAFAYVVGI